MHSLDWLVLSAYFVAMLGIGVWAKKRVKSARDFFTAGGRMPWWLAGISHHMSGYSAAVFVAFAAIAYTTGFALYTWWALSIVFACTLGAFVFAPRWPRLRQRLNIISPLEYLTIRFNLPAQQVLAWSGAGLKIFDVGAKWTACAVLLQVFADVPLVWGVLLTGAITLVYSVVGGLWADALTDFGQFVIQLIAGILMFAVVLAKLGGISATWTLWDRLPEGHAKPFGGSYSLWFALGYCIITTLSYNGGTWNLAQRFIAAPDGAAARRASLLSAALYLVWPLVLFFPMWAAPLLVPGLDNAEESYPRLVEQMLPPGLIGLVLAGMFSHTMAMCSSDANAISAVVVRDIIPALRRGRAVLTAAVELAAGRVATFVFIALSLLIALTADRFGGVLGLLIEWFGALVGPIAVPMLLGMLRPFRRSGPSAALLSWAAGLVVFAVDKYAVADQITATGEAWATTIPVVTPVLASLLVFVVMGWVRPWRRQESDDLIEALGTDLVSTEMGGEVEKAGAARA